MHHPKLKQPHERSSSRARAETDTPLLFLPFAVTYWVITPEVATDSVVASLRQSWLRGADNDAHFCVASGMSNSRDPTIHWLQGLNRSSLVAAGRADLNLRLHTNREPVTDYAARPPETRGMRALLSKGNAA